MKKGKNVHVVPSNDGGWAVVFEGGFSIAQTFKRKVDAEKNARLKAKAHKSELLIHGRNGKIQRRDSYGNDPHPPKG